MILTTPYIYSVLLFIKYIINYKKIFFLQYKSSDMGKFEFLQMYLFEIYDIIYEYTNHIIRYIYYIYNFVNNFTAVNCILDNDKHIYTIKKKYVNLNNLIHICINDTYFTFPKVK